MATSGVGSSQYRLTGLGGSGIDSESIVSSLMRIEKVPIDKLSQKKQFNTWKRDDYRGITNLLKGFKTSFFDPLNPTTNMMSQTTFKKFTATALEGSSTSNVVSVSGTANSTAGSHTVTVNKMATADIALGTGAVTKALTSSQDITSAGNEATDIGNLNGKKLQITLDGVSREITMGSYSNMTDLASGLQNLIGTAFGLGKINVNATGYKLDFSTASSNVSQIVLGSGTTNDGLSALKFDNGDRNRLNTGLTLGQIASKFSTPLTFAGGELSVSSSSDITNNAWNGKNFNITVDGVTKNIAFTSDPANTADLATTLQGLLDTQFGAGKINITESPSNRLTFERGANTGYVTFNSGDSANDALSLLKVDSGASASGRVKFTINSKEFEFKASQTLSNVTSTITADSTAKVNMTYDEVQDKFKITSTRLGDGDNIVISNSLGNFFSGASKMDALNPVTTQGTDAEAVIDGQTLKRSSNSFTVNGVSYNLLRESAVEQKVNLTTDVDGVYNNVKNFIDKYNELISKLNVKLSEEYDSSYQPLTDDQRASMSDDTIKKWEDKAKTGLLKNDSILQKAVSNMRRALSDSVSGITTSLTTIGITTGTYEEKGKLYIDEAKLKSAIQNSPESVMDLFTKKSDYSYTDASKRSTRFSEEGLANRLSDIIQDNIRTTRDSSGKKGLLVEKAGIEGDATEYSNTLYKEIYNNSLEIYKLNSRLTAKENAYYKKFTAMESALSKMSSQSSWISSALK